MRDPLRLTPVRQSGSPYVTGDAVAGRAAPGVAPSLSSGLATPYQHPHGGQPSPGHGPAAGGWRAAIVERWLRLFFYTSEHLPWIPRLMRGVVSRLTPLVSRQVRQATLANAARVLGPASSPAERRRLSRHVVDHFFRFCVDVGGSVHLTRQQLLQRISRVEGHENYASARSAGRGLIIVTAHMGSFEVGLASITSEDIRVHVIFRRDEQGGFERQRSTLRHRLGVIENPVDDGWTMWIGLRDALAAGEAVIFQGDRVMPGQRGRPVPFLHGTLEVPTGPVKLSRISGAPILPIFTLREPDDRVRVCIEPPLRPQEHDPHAPGEDPLLLALARVIERYVRQHPEQWLMFQPAFLEDQSGSRKCCPPGATGPKESNHV